MTVQDQVIAIIADQAMLDPSDITLSTAPADIGLDSIGMVECIFQIEETFDVTIPFNANTPQDGTFDISSVAAIVAAVEDLIKARG